MLGGASGAFQGPVLLKLSEPGSDLIVMKFRKVSEAAVHV